MLYKAWTSSNWFPEKSKLRRSFQLKTTTRNTKNEIIWNSGKFNVYFKTIIFRIQDIELLAWRPDHLVAIYSQSMYDGDIFANFMTCHYPFHQWGARGQVTWPSLTNQRSVFSAMEPKWWGRPNLLMGIYYKLHFNGCSVRTYGLPSLATILS